MKGRLSLLDATFLQIETRATPMHIASLQTFRRPKDAARSFVKDLVEAYRGELPNAAPWNLKLERRPFSAMAPAMGMADDIDMAYHVRHTALPDPGGERELGELVSHLHGQLLDRSRPLWTCHFIDGLGRDRFAIYLKVHHALTDGVRGIRMVERSLATRKNGKWSAPWCRTRPRGSHGTGVVTHQRESASPIREWPGHLRSALQPNRGAASEPVTLPFSAPRSVLNGPVTAARRVATQELDIQRIRAIGRRSGTSLNDVFLTVCSSALRRHLESSGDLPEAPLVAGVPVSLRAPGDSDSGNAVGLQWASLATNQEGPAVRLKCVHASMQATKNHLYSLPDGVRLPYTMARMTPVIAVLMSGQGARVRPPMNVTISNVPGPTKPLYLNGAKLESIYPVSIPFQGQCLNITCISYAGQLNVGLVGSRDSLPHLQRIAVYMGEALDELDRAIT